MKAYRDSKGYRKIPIGYSAGTHSSCHTSSHSTANPPPADIASLRPMLQNYLACGGNTSQTVDFFSLNAYEWCGPNTYETSGYNNLQSQAQDYPVPIFFSETGCNTAPPRTFEDQAAIFGPDMADTWSGAIIYEWIQEANGYGLVSYPGTNTASAAPNIVRGGAPATVSPDFANLKSQWASLSPTGVALSAYSASASSLSTPACPSSTPDGWLINGNPPIPTIGQSATFNPTGSQVKSAAATPTGSGGGAATSSASSAAGSSKVASPDGWREMAGLMSLALGLVMVGFVVWL